MGDTDRVKRSPEYGNIEAFRRVVVDKAILIRQICVGANAAEIVRRQVNLTDTLGVSPEGDLAATVSHELVLLCVGGRVQQT